MALTFSQRLYKWHEVATKLEHIEALITEAGKTTAALVSTLDANELIQNPLLKLDGFLARAIDETDVCLDHVQNAVRGIDR